MGSNPAGRDRDATRHRLASRADAGALALGPALLGLALVRLAIVRLAGVGPTLVARVEASAEFLEAADELLDALAGGLLLPATLVRALAARGGCHAALGHAALDLTTLRLTTHLHPPHRHAAHLHAPHLHSPHLHSTVQHQAAPEGHPAASRLRTARAATLPLLLRTIAARALAPPTLLTLSLTRAALLAQTALELGDALVRAVEFVEEPLRRLVAAAERLEALHDPPPDLLAETVADHRRARAARRCTLVLGDEVRSEEARRQGSEHEQTRCKSLGHRSLPIIDLRRLVIGSWCGVAVSRVSRGPVLEASPARIASNGSAARDSTATRRAARRDRSMGPRRRRQRAIATGDAALRQGGAAAVSNLPTMTVATQRAIEPIARCG